MILRFGYASNPPRTLPRGRFPRKHGRSKAFFYESLPRAVATGQGRGLRHAPPTVSQHHQRARLRFSKQIHGTENNEEVTKGDSRKIDEKDST